MSQSHPSAFSSDYSQDPQPQLQIVVNNASSSAKVRLERGTDAAGNMTATLTIEDIEAGLADRILWRDRKHSRRNDR